MDVIGFHNPTSDEAGCVSWQAPASSGVSPAGQEPFASPGMAPARLSMSRPAWPTLPPSATCPRWPSACALPCSGKVGAGLALQSVAVTSTAQKRRHFRLHIPVLRLEVGDQAPHLHGDSAVGLVLLCTLTLGRTKTKQNKTRSQEGLNGGRGGGVVVSHIARRKKTGKPVTRPPCPEGARSNL